MEYYLGKCDLRFFFFCYEQKSIPIYKKYYQLWVLATLGFIMSTEFIMTLRLWVS